MSCTCVGMCTAVHMWSEHIWGVGSFPLPCGSSLLNIVVRLNSLLSDLDSKNCQLKNFELKVKGHRAKNYCVHSVTSKCHCCLSLACGVYAQAL